MRPIRFRAWDGYEMRYSWGGFEDVDPLNLSDLMYPYCKNNLMQFTGLKDKNGKEIWESDLVMVDGCKEPKEMKFKDGAFMLEGIYGGSGAYRVDKYPIPEIIGNIYENPELLKP